MSASLDKLLDEVNWTPVEQPPGMTGMSRPEKREAAVSRVPHRAPPLARGGTS